MGDLVSYLKSKTKMVSSFENFASNLATGRLKSDTLIIQQWIDKNTDDILGYYTTTTVWSGVTVYIVMKEGILISAPNLNGFPER